MNRKNKILAGVLACGMIFSLAACGADPDVEMTDESVPQTTVEENNSQSAPQQSAEKEPEIQTETEQAPVSGVYDEVLEKYRSALREKWDPEKLMAEDMSILLSYCYEGEPLENVGYALMDLNGDGADELLIGAMQEDEFLSKMVFELFACENDSLIHVFSAQERNRYYLIEDEAAGYYFANEASMSADTSGWFYENLNGSQMKVFQGILYSDAQDAQQPWFMVYKKSFDTQDAQPCEEETALAIIDSYTNDYIIPEYTSFYDGTSGEAES